MAGKKILIVEDEGIIAEYLRRILNNNGYQVHPPVAYGEKVLETALQFQPDLVLMDVMLSGSMNGIEAAAAVRAHMDIPIIYLSAYAEDTLLSQAQATDPYAYLVKPVQDRELQAAIQVAFHKHAVNQQLTESENRFRQVVESASEVFWLRSKETGQVIYVSPAFERIFGLPCSALYADSNVFYQVIHPADLERVRRARQELEEADIPFNEEYRILTPSGKVTWLWARSNPVPDSLGRVVRFAGAAEDVTSRKEAEEALRNSYEELQLQYRRLALLSQIDQSIIRSGNTRQMIQSIMDNILSSTGLRRAALWERGRGERLIESSISAGALLPRAETDNTPAWEESLAARVYVTRQTLFSSNGRQASAAAACPPEQIEGCAANCSYVLLPLITREECKGVLGLFRSGGAGFSEDELSFFDALSTQLAIAIDNAQMQSRIILSDMEVSAAYEATLQSFAQTLELRDKETRGHSDRVVDLTLQLAHALDFPQDQIEHLRRGAILHDLGKLLIPNEILRKPGKLDDAEWKVMRQHPQYAYQMLAGIPFLEPALQIPLHHHERWDGAGYPDGLQGEEIPLAARIFSVIDVWDALLEERPYRPAWTVSQARQHLAEQAGKQFDPRVVEVFLRQVMPAENSPSPAEGGVSFP